MNCSKPFFTKDEFASSLSRVVRTAFRSSNLTGEETPINEVYNKIIEQLKNTDLFLFTYEQGVRKQTFINSINDIKDTISTYAQKYLEKRDNISNDSAEFSRLLNGIMQDTGLEDVNVTPTEEASVPDILGIDLDGEKERRERKLSSIVREFYGTALGASQYRHDEFARDLLGRAIINTEQRVIVKDNTDLNRQIAFFKNDFLADIKAFLDTVQPNNSYSGRVFNEEGKVIQGYLNTLNAFYNYIQNNYKAKLSELSGRVDQGWKHTLQGDQDLFFNAVNSYVNLVYFDDLLVDALGKTIEINNDFKGFEVDAVYNKYAFSNGGEHKVKNWGAVDTRNAMNDIAKFSKLVISLVPMKSNRNGRDLNRNVSITAFSNAMTALFRAGSLVSSDYKELKNALYRFHSNPSLYSEVILKYINSDTKSIKNALIMKGLTEFDLNVLCSVYDYIFNSDNLNSVKNIETEVTKKRFTVGRYSIINAVTGVMDRVMDASYLQTTYDSDGFAITEAKKKSPQRREQYSMYQNINQNNIVRGAQLRKTLAEKYPLARVAENDTSEYTITIGDTIYNVKAKGSMGILGFKPLEISGSSRYSKIFSRQSSTIDLLNSSVIDRLLDSENVLKGDEKIFRDILKFIDTFLGTKFLTKDGLNTLQIYKTVNRDENFIKTLFSSAIRVAVVNDLYTQFNNKLNEGLYKDEFDFIKFLKEVYKPFESVSLKEEKDYFIDDFGIKNLISISTNAEWLDPYAKAKSILNGEINKAVTKDLQGNAISNYRTAFLGGNIQYYLSKTRDRFKEMKVLDENAILASDSLLFTEKNDLITRVVLNNDIQSRNGIKKNIKDLKPSELYYTSIFHNFFGNYLGLNVKENSDNLKGTFIIQPSTYSDKTSFLNYAIDADKKLKAPGKSYDGKSLAEINSAEAVDLYLDTVGKAYKEIYQSVLNDYAQLFGRPMTVFEINKELKKYSEESLIALAVEKKVPLQLDTHYKSGKGGLMFNELLYHYAQNLYASPESLKSRMKTEELNFLNDLLDSNVFFYTKYYDDVTSKNSTNPIMQAIKSGKFIKDRADYESKWIKNNKLILAKVDGKNILYGSRIKNYKNLELNPLLEKFLYTESLLSNNLRFSLTGSEIAHPTKKLKINWKQELKDAGLENYAPLYKGDKPNEAFLSSLINIEELINQILQSPDISEFEIETANRLSNLYNSVIRKTEALAQGTQLKRNVIIPATLQYVQQGVMNGVPSKMKVAVIRDLNAKIFNFRGDKSGEDAHDGSAWINPFISILENLSLQDQEVGIDKKPIWHHYDDKLMTATLLKFATFTITNERMLSSLQSDVQLYKLFKQMTNEQWQENGVWKNSKGAEIDLVRGKGFGRKNINFSSDILQDTSLFYDLNGRHYQILDLQKDDSGNYYTVETEVNVLGNPINSNNQIKVYHFFDGESNHMRVQEEMLPTTDVSQYHPINSLFELHSALGGIFSESLNEDHKLVYSEASNHAVVNYMNNISIKVGSDTSDLSQNTYYQPLKEMMISYAANNSAVKNGASNINQSNAWYGDTKLSYMEIDSDGLGIQMDADHEIDEAEMTEFSQVVAALEAGGRLHNSAKQVYKALGKIALIASQVEVKAVIDYIKKSNDSNVSTDQILTDLYDVVGRTMINNFKKDPDKAELASEIIQKISETFNLNSNHVKDEFLIPFSDPNIYSNILPTFVSTINNKSIKRKYPGSGCVMVPGFRIIQNFKVGGKNYQFNDLLVRAREENQRRIDAGEEPLVKEYNNVDLVSYNKELIKQYLQSFQDKEEVLPDNGVFIPTDFANVIFRDGAGKIHEVEINLDDIDTYYSFKGGNTSLAKLLLEGKYKDVNGEFVTSIEGIEVTIDEKGNPKYIEKLDEEGNPITLFKYRQNVTAPRNLQPARITWSYEATDAEGNIVLKHMNIYDLEPIRNSFKKPPIIDRDAIQKVFDDLDKGIFYINGVEYKALNLQNKPAEMVMSNLYASKFNTKGMSLADILERGPEFFEKQQKRLAKSDKYELALVKGNNRNTYITFKDIQTISEEGLNITKSDWPYIKRREGNVYYMTKDNQELFKIGKDVVRPDLRYDETERVFKDKDTGNIVDNPNLINGDNGEVLEYIEFISRYTVSQRDSKGKYTNFQLYKVDEEKIRTALVRHEGQTEESFSTDVRNFIADRLKAIYKSDSYKSIQLNSKIPTNTAKSLCQIFRTMKMDKETTEYLDNLSRLLTNSLKLDESQDPTYSIDTKAQKNIVDDFNKSLAMTTYNSFKKSLTFTASRIPAQTLQSFMQMELTGFTQSSKNIVYVSHWQTWLQGSDYDIDKAYIMGFEFDDNGKFVGWSDLFNYSTEQTLEASTYLPAPNKVAYSKTSSFIDITELLKEYKSTQDSKIREEIINRVTALNPEIIKDGAKRTIVTWKEDNLNDLGNSIIEELNSNNDRIYLHSKNVVDINSYIQDILSLSGNEPAKIHKYADLLTMLGDYDYDEDGLGNKKLFVTWDSSIESTVGRSILSELNKHEFTEISPLLTEAAYKNLVSSRIQKIVQNLRNMDAAYSPIEMEGIRHASEASPKGELAGNMTLMNPLTKYLMQVSNMVGKGVIGITAVGEKVFFNNSFYWNEGLRSADYKWHRNMQFSQTFNRIQGRSLKNIQPTTKTTIANANFEDVEEMRRVFIDLNPIDSELRIRFGITDEDILTQNEKWQAYHDELMKEVKKKQDIGWSADLTISELLSAATDNAKELILSKINAGTNLARMYLHLIIMGFHINDIASFMISPAVSLINDLSEANMFDEYMYSIRVQDAAQIVRGNISPAKFFIGTSKNAEGVDKPKSTIAFNHLKSILNGKLAYELVKKKNGEEVSQPKKYKSFGNLIQDFIMYRLQGKVKSLEELIEDNSKLGIELKGNILNLSDYIENLVSKMKAGIDLYEVESEEKDTAKDIFNKKLEQFYADLDEFDKVWDLATETSTLGSAFYGLNQGLPTSKVDLLSKLRTLQNSVGAREKALGVDLEAFTIKPTDSENTAKEKKELREETILRLRGNNPLLNISYISEVFDMAEQLGIMNNFDIEKWLTDVPVSFKGDNINVSSYREAITEYYNIIKGTWNIFDMIQRIPHYKSIFELLKTTYVSDYAISQKSSIVNMSAKEIAKTTGYMDDQDMKSLLRYIDELLILNWIKQGDFQDNFKFIVQQGQKQFNRYVDRITSSKDSFIDLSTSEGRATFKLIMETEIIPSLKEGYYTDVTLTKDATGQTIIGDKVRKTISDKNPFIQGLVDNIEQGVPFKKLDIDMMNVNSTPASSIKFFDYLSGLYELKNKELYGQPLSSWFMLYNILVNQNQYGSDRLTTIFKPFVGLIDEDSLISQYFKEVGRLDYNSIHSMEDLYNIGFNMKDALIKMARFTSSSEERNAKASYIKQSDKRGGVVYKEKLSSGGYKEISILPKKTLSGDGDNMKRRQRQKDFRDYWIIKTPMQDADMLLNSNMESKNIEELVQALISYTSKGILKIYKYNC